VLRAGEFVGRCWCQIDLVGMHRPIAIEGASNNEASGWVPTGTDLLVPTDPDDIRRAARRAAYALARSAGVPAWDARGS
jgi:hypothetical protein